MNQIRQYSNESVDSHIFSVLKYCRDFISNQEEESRNQCHFTLFFSIKREPAQTQTTLTSRVVNVTDVLNLNYLYR